MSWHDHKKSETYPLKERLAPLAALLGKAISWPFFRLLDFTLYRRQKYYEKLTRYCLTAYRSNSATITTNERTNKAL